MSLLNKASLIQIPSGYKDGTLYSAKPTNGDGDFTFSRGSNLAATRVNSEGLIEKGRENLLLQSNSFNTTWITSNASVTGGQSGYDGSSDAWLFETTVAGASVQQAFTSTGVLTYSVYAKAGSVNGIRLRIDATSDANGYYDLVNGTIFSSEGIDASISDVGNGWYKCSLSQNVSGAVKIQFFTTDGTTSYDNGNIYIQDSQLELGLVATDYIETGASTAQAGILEDMPRLDYSGGATCPSLLLEPQRTNLFEHSEYFGDWNVYRGSLTANDATSPEGINNAYRYEENSDSGQHFVRKTISMTSGTTYTASAFVKADEITSIKLGSSNTGNWNASATFNLSDGTLSSGTGTIEDYGNGWYRCIITAACTTTSSIGLEITTSSGAGSSGDGLYIYGAQIEVGSYVSSYIPTYGASVTRAEDFMNISSLADEIDGNSFTYFLEVNNEAVVRDSSIGNILVGATVNRFFLYNSSSTSSRLRLFIQDSGGTEQYLLSADNVKLAIRFEPNNVEVFENGVSVKSTTQNLDFSANSAYVLRGTTREIGIKQNIIFPTALSDDECIQLTTI